jgi:site-specific recombinase XerD
MRKQIKVSKLCNELEGMLLKLNYSEDSMCRYRKVFREFIEFSADCNYSQAEGTNFLISRFNLTGRFVSAGEHSKNQMYYFRVIRSLAEYYNFGIIFRRKDFHGEIVWPLPFKGCTEEFLKSRIEYGVSYGYIKNCRSTLKDLILCLDALDVYSPEAITFEAVSHFINSLVGLAPVTINSRVSELRNYFRFLYLEGYIREPISEKLPRIVSVTRTKLPTVWTEEQVEKVIEGVDLASPCGKRDYAMILFAARLGLRVGDIMKLQLTDIDWKENKITIIQSKTKETLVLPLPNEVGWALINYLREGRPITDSTNVFVRHLPPYDGFTIASNLLNVIAKAVRCADIPAEKKNSFGWRTLRHSLATNLLQNNVELSTISSILGHSSPETVKHYIRVDLDGLRKCALKVEVKLNASE